jgi:hypothetical protein
MKNAVFWDVPSCGSCENRSSKEGIASIFRVTSISELGTMLVVTSNRNILCKI